MERHSFVLTCFMLRQISLGVFVLLVLSSCKETEHHSLVGGSADTLKLSYAHGFRVTAFQGDTLIDVIQPFQGATSSQKYLLVHRGDPVPVHDPSIPVIYTPVRRIVCTSTTHIPLLDYLHETDKLVGFPTTDYISSPLMRARIDSGHVVDLGVDKGMDLERLKLLKPDLVMGYSMNANNGQFTKIRDMGIPVVINAEYLESHPLGRAEWIRFMALFFERSGMADSVFSAIASQYSMLAAATDTISHRPTVMSGIVYGDAWFLPGGQNYAAKLLRDAGCHYLWEGDSSTGFLQLSFESVYQTAHDADLWIGVGSYASLAEIKSADGRYTKFKAYQNGNVYTYDARKGATAGSEFLELGYLRPDLILGDLERIAHPGLLPEKSLYFYERLR